MGELSSTGKVIGINGSIVDVEFLENMPRVNDLLTLGEDKEVKLLVYKSSSEKSFYCINLTTAISIARGATVVSLESELRTPVGEQILGRIVDIFGRPRDGKGPINASEMRPV